MLAVHDGSLLLGAADDTPEAGHLIGLGAQVVLTNHALHAEVQERFVTEWKLYNVLQSEVGRQWNIPVALDTVHDIIAFQTIGQVNLGLLPCFIETGFELVAV